ncbi:hypothetical protein J2D73_18525 [Acetobacter sacchari]|uniref:Uncharacterized protein n=1 Tax=Acetobacter sacchari TaxID=2661687 RepID=A0ABS3M0Q9_9PROT|nr:hypothetical protein [Acetobacter sacchari]MBO1361781.1 hypothetical protein [Acetobacter sacchari]
MKYEDEAPRHSAAGFPLPQTAWALVRDGSIEIIVKKNSRDVHPFGDEVEIADPHAGPIPLDGVCALRVTGTLAHTGDLVDDKGNVTPREGRDRPLRPGESAMHSGPGAARVAAKVAPVAEPVAPESEQHESAE